MIEMFTEMIELPKWRREINDKEFLKWYGSGGTLYYNNIWYYEYDGNNPITKLSRYYEYKKLK